MQNPLTMGSLLWMVTVSDSLCSRAITSQLTLDDLAEDAATACVEGLWQGQVPGRICEAWGWLSPCE